MRLPSARSIAFAALLSIYLLITLGVIFQSPLLRLDTDVFKLNLRHNYPKWEPTIHHFVILGQRGPATLFLLPFFFWRAWRDRSARPLTMLVTSLTLLNLSVGIVKLATGRIGPDQTHMTHDVFVGGDIYPSGQVSNTVVLYGLMAMIAISYRRLIALASVLLSVLVGLSTVYLDAHWFSDVIGGWAAGGLVLLALPWIEPTVRRCTNTAWRWFKPLLARYVPRRRGPSETEPPRSPPERDGRPFDDDPFGSDGARDSLVLATGRRLIAEEGAGSSEHLTSQANIARYLVQQGPPPGGHGPRDSGGPSGFPSRGPSVQQVVRGAGRLLNLDASGGRTLRTAPAARALSRIARASRTVPSSGKYPPSGAGLE